MRRKIDLHLHTNASDGTWLNIDLLLNIKLSNISIFSITDHDTITNAIAMTNQSLPSGVKFIVGVEFSSIIQGIRYHILAYAFDFSNLRFQEILKFNASATEEWFNNIVEYACKKYTCLSMSEYREYKNDPQRGGCKPINYLLDNKILRSVNDFFELIKEGQIVPMFCSIDKIISGIKNAGGISFLAHPSEYGKGSAMSEDKLNEWINLGIDGIECYHPSSKPADTYKYLQFCKNNGLMVSGGSDCHGTFIPERRIGLPEIYDDMISVPI